MIQITNLEEFVDEEVVDNRGKPIGVLACFWESATGQLFLGVKPEGEDAVHVVPGEGSSLDEPHSCVKLDVSGRLVKSAPVFDCDLDLRPRLEKAAQEHFELTGNDD